MNDSFAAKFCFKPEYRGHLGVERECFLMSDGKITPSAVSILNLLPKDGTYGYELSACQLEMRTLPSLLSNLYEELNQVEKVANDAACMLGIKLEHVPVAPNNMPIDIYPDPTGRYASIVEKLPHDILLAACRVAAVHIHIGVRDADEAINVYNRLVNGFDELKHLGDTCNGQRLKLYRMMASDNAPKMYSSWNEYHDEMQKRGCVDDPRRCWDMVRISTHGTVEVRVFDAVPNIERIVSWAETVTRLADIAR